MALHEFCCVFVLSFAGPFGTDWINYFKGVLLSSAINSCIGCSELLFLIYVCWTITFVIMTSKLKCDSKDAKFVIWIETYFLLVLILSLLLYC